MRPQPNTLPLLLVGSGNLGPRQAQLLLPLARPLYYLASPRHVAPSARCHPITIGHKQHELALDQWQAALYPGHAALAFMAPRPEEDSWRQLKQKIKGVAAAEGFTPQDRHILLFLLQTRLDAALAEQQQLAQQYQQATAKLLANIDSQIADDFWPMATESQQDCGQRLSTWSAVAAKLDLPCAIWAMPYDLFKVWQPQPLASLPWPGAEQLRQKLQEIDHSSFSGQHSHGPGIYKLPATAKQLLLSLAYEYEPEDFICLVWP